MELKETYVEQVTTFSQVLYYSMKLHKGKQEDTQADPRLAMVSWNIYINYVYIYTQRFFLYTYMCVCVC